MWARIVEVMLGCWLIISPFIFRLEPDQTFLWANDLGAGAAIIVVALTAISERFSKVRLLNLGVAAYLVLISYLTGGTPPPPAPYQNFMVIALLLLLTAVIPSRATLPPASWQAFYEGGDKESR